MADSLMQQWERLTSIVDSSDGYILDFPAPLSRLFLRLYFTILLALAPVLGNSCFKIRSQKLLDAGGSLPCMHMTGWLSLSQIAESLWLLRVWFLGWFGLVMLLAGVLAPISDYSVAIFVVESFRNSRCSFSTDGEFFVVKIPDELSESSNVPDAISYPVDFILQAQRTSRANQGRDGIYRKVNADPNFRAESRDVWGTWTCTTSEEVPSYKHDEDPQVIGSDLEDKGLLHNGGYSCSNRHTKGGEVTRSQLAFFSSNGTVIDDFDDAEWTIKASFDTTADPMGSKLMRSFECSLTQSKLSADNAKLIISVINIEDVIDQLWCHRLRNPLHTGLAEESVFSNTPGQNLTSILNTMTMSVGYLRNNETKLIGDETQGCVVSCTLIPWVVVTLFAFVGVVFFGLLWYWVWLHFETWLHPLTEVAMGAPFGLLSWMKFGVGAEARHTKMRLRHLKFYEARVGRERLEIMRARHPRLGGDVNQSGAVLLEDREGYH